MRALLHRRRRSAQGLAPRAQSNQPGRPPRKMLQSHSAVSVVPVPESRLPAGSRRPARNAGWLAARTFAFAAAAACLMALGAVSSAEARTGAGLRGGHPGEPTGAVVQDAMRRAIVRATGRREAGPIPRSPRSWPMPPVMYKAPARSRVAPPCHVRRLGHRAGDHRCGPLNVGSGATVHFRSVLPTTFLARR